MTGVRHILLVMVRYLLLLVIVGGTNLAGATIPPTTAAGLPAALTPDSISFGPAHTVGDAYEAMTVMVAGDLDWDARPDLVAASGHRVQVWQNPASPFAVAWTSIMAASFDGDIGALALGDLDNNGYPDLVAGLDSAATAELVLLRNDGTPFSGVWPASNAGMLTGSIHALALADLDQDGWLDIISDDGFGQLLVWQNDGSPFSGAWTPTQVTSTGLLYLTALATADLDVDGYLDVVAFGADPGGGWFVSLYANPGLPFAVEWPQYYLISDVQEYTGLRVADLDEDGNPDIAFGVGGNTWVYWNLGDPYGNPSYTWGAQTVGTLDRAVQDITAEDWDQDGDPDLASGTQANSAGAEVWSWENQSGAWVGAGAGETTGRDVVGLAAPDLDLDGDPDLVAAAGARLFAWQNQRPVRAQGNWTEGLQPLPAVDALGVDLADWNHDGRRDVAAGTTSGVYAWAGDGGASWTRVGEGKLPESGVWSAVEWGQIDRLGELDLAAASEEEGLRAWLSQEGGTVWADASGGLPADGAYHDLALGHLNHDGILDLVAAGQGLGVRIWAGSGGEWSDKGVLQDGKSFCGVALGDINRDGNLDVVAANCDGGILLCRGDGDWGFTCSGAPTSANAYRDVAIGDVHVDGRLDLVAARAAGGVQTWLAGDSGTWIDAGVVSPSLAVERLDLGDIDRDGYLDLLAGGTGVHAWLGTGGVGWTAAGLGLPTAGSYAGVALGRIDGDAILDIAAAELGTSGVRIWFPIEPPPGGWYGFDPPTDPPSSWIRNQQTDCSVHVTDADSGLDVASAQYRFSRDGGTSWQVDGGSDAEGWRSASCTGASGTTDPQEVKAPAVPFNQDTADQNAIQFRIADLAGGVGTSPVYRVAVDTVPPANPTSVSSTSHTPGVWSTSRTVTLTWNDGTDATSGAGFYSYSLTTANATLPDQTADAAPGNQAAPVAGTDGQSWWFHLRTGDRAGNWSTGAVHVGPFWIDSQPPTSQAVAEVSTTHPTMVFVTCNAQDVSAPQSGVASCDLQYKGGAAPSWETLANGVAPGVPVQYNGTVGLAYCFRSRARDQAGNLEAWPAAADGDTCVTLQQRDLRIVSVTPIQAVEGAQLVIGKSTAFRVVVESTFDMPVDVEFRLTLPPDQWTTAPVCANIGIGVQPGWSYPDLWGPVQVDPGSNEIMLPFVAPGQENATWPSQAAGIVRCGCVGGVCAPDVRVVPRPRVANVSAQVTVDAGSAVHETDEYNNTTAMPNATAATTRPFSFLFVPWVFNRDAAIAADDSAYEFHLHQWGYTDASTRIADVASHTSGGRVSLTRALSTADIERLQRSARQYVEYILGSFPYADGQVTYRFDDRYLYFGEEYKIYKGQDRCTGDMRPFVYDEILRETSPAPSEVVFMHIWGCCGQTFPSNPATGYKAGRWIDVAGGQELAAATFPHRCDVGAATADHLYAGATEYVAAHEMGHNLSGAADCYGCEAPGNPVDCNFCEQDAAGFWVNRWDRRPLGAAWNTGLYFMHGVCTGCRYWMRLAPMKYENGTDFPDGYRNTITWLAPGRDPAALVVRGDLSQDGTARFDPLVILPEAELDLAPGTDGDYAFVLVGDGEKELSRTGFSPSFEISGRYPDPITSVDTIHFAYRIEWQPGTRRIELRDAQDNVLASQEVSAHAPQVQVLDPNGGEVLDRGQPLAVHWTASDQDNDPLTHSVALSPDGGQTWQLVEADLTATETTIDTSGLAPGGHYRIRVRSSDGVNTAEDQSDGDFAVRGALYLPMVNN